jgi:CheY-like chemotaxis protein
MTGGRSVLVVEDDQQWQAILKETLEDEGYGVTVIGDYGRSRKALENDAYDLVVVDLELDPTAPTLEGKRLLNLISRHYSDTPSIVVSVKSDAQIVRDAFRRYQVVDYITKVNFDIPAFLKAVETAFTLKERPTSLREIVDKKSGLGSAAPLGCALYAIPDYDRILQIIQNMAAVMERSPQAFAEMDEEGLRQHFLVQLNGQFAGNATGETFNYTGNTDILVRVNGKNLFIAECKFWKGPKSFFDTIDQLLGYANWRDTKTAILLFNRRRAFSYILSRIPDVVESHPCFKQKLDTSEETVFRYVFQRPDDADRELLLTVLAFDIPR